jgi:hypothetical protein
MKNTGGPAYPRNHVPGTVTTDGEGRQHHTRLTTSLLRDYFAAVALTALINTRSDGDGFDEHADDAYAIADAMLKERDK